MVESNVGLRPATKQINYADKYEVSWESRIDFAMLTFKRGMNK